MTPTEARIRLKAVYSTLSNDDYEASLKLAYDILIGITSYEFGISGAKYENLSSLEVLNLVFRYFCEKKFKDIHFMMEDICTLMIYYEKPNRITGSHELLLRIRVLIIKIIGVIEYFLLEKKDGSFSVDNFESPLLKYEDIFQDDISIKKVKILNYYYYIESRYFEIHKTSFWNKDVENLDFIFGNYSEWLTYISVNIENAIVDIDLEVIEELITNIDKEENEVNTIFEQQILRNKNMSIVSYEIDDFIRRKNMSGKNTFKEDGDEKEATFHEMLFMDLNKKRESTSVVMSEIPFARNRFDIVWIDINTKLSTIIELKVNELNDLEENIKQVERYLQSDTDDIFYKVPDFGVLFIYCITNKTNEFVIDKLMSSGYEFEELRNTIVINSTLKPIMIKIIFNPYAKAVK